MHFSSDAHSLSFLHLSVFLSGPEEGGFSDGAVGAESDGLLGGAWSPLIIFVQ